jgi:hypothetical protein
MTAVSRFALLLAAAATAALLAAPAAGARPTCRDGGTDTPGGPSTTSCVTDGSVSIRATPGTKAPPANRPQIAGLPWYQLS